MKANKTKKNIFLIHPHMVNQKIGKSNECTFHIMHISIEVGKISGMATLFD